MRWSRIPNERSPLPAALLVVCLVCAQALHTRAVFAQDGARNPGSIELLFFWKEGCPACGQVKPFLEILKQRYPALTVRDYEITAAIGNIALLRETAGRLGAGIVNVPFIAVGNRYWIGFSAEIAGEIELVLRDPVSAELFLELSSGTSSPQADGSAPAGTSRIAGVDPSTIPLFAATALIAFVDGFNPCSLWTLTFLLGMILHTGSRKRIVLVGFVFLFTTALIYGLFIAGIVQVLSFIAGVRWIRLLVAAAAVVFGAVHMKEFFFYREGISLTIRDSDRLSIIGRSRSLALYRGSMLGLVGFTTAMAAGVALVELPCTAGFPVIWSDLVTSRGLPAGAYLSLIALYLFVYLMDEILVFGAVVLSMKRFVMEQKHGRILKLVSGTLMVILGGVMAFAPDAADSLWSLLLMFFTAAAVAGSILIGERLYLRAKRAD